MENFVLLRIYAFNAYRTNEVISLPWHPDSFYWQPDVWKPSWHMRLKKTVQQLRVGLFS